MTRIKTLLVAMVKWVLRKIEAVVLWVAGKVGKMGRWFARLPYKVIGMRVATRLGNFLHTLLFDFLLPKKVADLSKERMFNIIFKSDTPAGKRFDVWLLVLIALNMVLLMVESLPSVHEVRWLDIALHTGEWLFTILFTFEYYIRIYCSKEPFKYVLSKWGIIDILSIFPAYLSLLFPAAHTFTVFRLLRMLRVFRIFKMDKFVNESRFLLSALSRSAVKIFIFMLFVYIAAVILGSVMYAVESEKNPDVFNSIPNGIYWAVVTLTTVGYGDMTPITPLGRFIAIVVMMLGYAIIAVPTGIVAGETIAEHNEKRHSKKKTKQNDASDDNQDDAFL